MRHALIFAAGRGERMRPLTDATPKPLLAVGGKPLIVWHLEKLAAAGVRDVVVNVAHLAGQFPEALGDGRRWGLRIHYSREEAGALETGGGMLHALPLLGAGSFLVVNGDVWSDVDYTALPEVPAGLAHLVLTANPPQHPDGDFHLDAGGVIRATGEPRLTYTGIGVFRHAFLDGWQAVVGTATGEPPRFRLRPLLDAAIARGALHGSTHAGRWTDVGTPARLAALDAELGGR